MNVPTVNADRLWSTLMEMGQIGGTAGGGCRRLALSQEDHRARDLFRRPLMPQELRDYDAVVFDPPRQGAQAQARQLAASKIPVSSAISFKSVARVKRRHISKEDYVFV